MHRLSCWAWCWPLGPSKRSAVPIPCQVRILGKIWQYISLIIIIHDNIALRTCIIIIKDTYYLIFPQIRARHGIGTADLLDGPSGQHQAQHSSRGPVSSLAANPCSIKPLTQSPARVQQPHVGPRKKPCRAWFRARCGARGLELGIYNTNAIRVQNNTQASKKISLSWRKI